MKVQVLSDLHLEFHRDGGVEFVDSLPTPECDCVVIAGDLTNAKGLARSVDLVCKKFDKPIVYVTGNHEYYTADRETVEAILVEAEIRNDNFHWLSNGVVVINGQRFIGAPLWYRPIPPEKNHLKMSMNDGRMIRGFENWVHIENAMSIDFFRDCIEENDVVVTHYLPSNLCVAPCYQNNPLNIFFVCEMDDIIKSSKPKVWIHGHTHESIKRVIDSTRIVCNPAGYLGENAFFKPGLVIEV